MALQGPGTFNLALPLALSNVQTVTAEEGQPAAGGFAAQNEVIDLRAGTSITVNVSADASLNTANPKSATITIVGAANHDTINLASGADVVTVGGPNETVNLGSGADTINVTAATIGATIGNGTGQDMLDVSGGGAMAMGANINGIVEALLAPASVAYRFTANALSGLTIDDASTATKDTLIAGGAHQTLTGGGAGKDAFTGSAAGYDTLKDPTTMLNHDTISGFGAIGDEIDLTDLNAAKLKLKWSQTAGSAGTLTVSDGVHSAAITLVGQFVSADFRSGSDGATGTAITYEAPPVATLTSPHA